MRGLLFVGKPEAGLIGVPLPAIAPSGAVTRLLGPSGCGKTTPMRVIAGLGRPTEGRIRIGGRDVTDPPARRRDVGMVFRHPVISRPRTSPSRCAASPRTSAPAAWTRCSTPSTCATGPTP